MARFNVSDAKNDLGEILQSGKVLPIEEWYQNRLKKSSGLKDKFIRLGQTAENGLILASPELVGSVAVLHREIFLTHLQDESPLNERLRLAVAEAPFELMNTPIADAGFINMRAEYGDDLYQPIGYEVDLFDQSGEFGRANEEGRSLTLEIARAALPAEVKVSSRY